MPPWISFPQLPSELPCSGPGVEPRRSDGPGLSISVYPWRREVNVRKLLCSLVYVSLQKSWCMILCVLSSAGIDPERRQAVLPQPIVQLLQRRSCRWQQKLRSIRNNGFYILTLQQIRARLCEDIFDGFILTCRGSHWVDVIQAVDSLIQISYLIELLIK